MSPHFYYNALCRFHQGNTTMLRTAWERHHDWRKAWNATYGNERIDPKKEWGRLVKSNVRLLLNTDEQFPTLLREIPLAPFGLYIQGPFVFSPLTIAIVGTRRATYEGHRIAHHFAYVLGQYGVTVVSGLALGIDSSAHQGALSIRARTIAILPTGLDRIYPPHHTKLAKNILENEGSLISEYPFNSESLPYRFLERNRIVSGLSLGTLVIEAPQKSGALVTARCAVEQNREVFVVPGPIAHHNYVGSHSLIRQGATLVSTTNHILENLNIDIVPGRPLETVKISKTESHILSCIKEAGRPLTVDTIQELTKLEIHVVNNALALLTINGMIKEINGKYSCLN